jgi:hypothetical protein
VTSVFLFDNYTQAFANNISYSGTAAINSYSGSGQLIYDNWLYENRYEMSDGARGRTTLRQ